ncbi:Outer membrane efflux protein [Magnetospirillum gryphiswaldense MSR-1 v2]|uniref:Outer membrane efflux protein n=1 Tax=Magnetospirillum gryphiswaldense (strain DSM 6361 / JCM 21280 / NBRC 15271 / MSR-1) TaxID=431944 RepID=V6F6U0_MAGGM|nr:TolC family protein [Magnetospirillum gryphiswaldense]CDL01235.1 Outer membrane efflux protein [Magnetospirillum gryphiswaldense MSR-1 v2]
MVISAFGARRLLASVSLVALLSACAMTPEPFTPEQLAQSSKDDRTDMFKSGEPLSGPLTVSEAIARALKHNLDRRAKVMEEALALGQTDIDRWDMLPKLVANTNFTSRSEPNATRSRDLYTQTTSTSNPTYSADRDNYTADLGLSWNVLDFGLSYFTAKQNADRALIATERKRKAVHNLVQEVRFAFWRAAAHQELKAEVDTAVAEAKVALDRAEIVEKENLKAPAEALRYQKSLLETLRQLTAIQQELSTAEIELAALINAPPGTKLMLDVPKDMTVPAWDLDLEKMEEVAFVNNPDLREQGYQARISANDTRKAIVRLFPGITFSASRNYDHNSFLMANHWYEAGAKLSWNLMNLVSGPDAIKYAETTEDVAKAKRLALRMAVLAQVHVSERQFRNSISQYQQSDKLWRVDTRLFQLSEAKTANDAQGMLERVAGRASAIASALRRFQTYAQVEQSYAKMQASLGQDLMPESVASHDLPGLSAAIAERLATWGTAENKANPDAPILASQPMAIPMPSAAVPVAEPSPQESRKAPEPALPDQPIGGGWLNSVSRFLGIEESEEHVRADVERNIAHIRDLTQASAR